MENLTAKELYSKKKIQLAKKGLVIAWVSSLTLVSYQNFNIAATQGIFESFDDSFLTLFILTILSLGICEFMAGIMLIGYNSTQGVPLKEYPRLWKIKNARTVLLSAIAAGPIGTASAIVGLGLCGSTYGNSVIALTPIFCAIGARLFLKEKFSSRVALGIAIAVMGIIISGWIPPEDTPNFYLGLLIVAIAPLAYTAEAMISTHAMDVSEALEVCAFFRTLGGGIMEISIAFLLCVATGNFVFFTETFVIIFSSPVTFLLILGTAISMAIEYSTNYVAMNYAGAARAEALVFSTPIWSIPMGFIFQALGILPYSVGFFGVIGAFVVVIGVVMVIMKPSELFKLRDI